MLADSLMSVGAVQFGSFRLKLHETQPDAPPSPFFFNLRTPENPKPGPINSYVCKAIGFGFREVLSGEFDGVCGIPNAGEPLAKGMWHLDDDVDSKVITLVKEMKGDGSRRITGIASMNGFKPGARILLVDDVVTAADTKLEAIAVLREAGMVIEDLIVVVDREQGGADRVRQEGVRVHALYGVRELIDYYHRAGRIDAMTHDRALSYLSTSIN